MKALEVSEADHAALVRQRQEFYIWVLVLCYRLHQSKCWGAHTSMAINNACVYALKIDTGMYNSEDAIKEMQYFFHELPKHMHMNAGNKKLFQDYYQMLEGELKGKHLPLGTEDLPTVLLCALQECAENSFFLVSKFFQTFGPMIDKMTEYSVEQFYQVVDRGPDAQLAMISLGSTIKSEDQYVTKLALALTMISFRFHPGFGRVKQS